MIAGVLALVIALAPQTVAVTTSQHAATIAASAKFNATLNTTIDSTTARAGDSFTLTVTDPSYPAMDGAKIVGHFTSVEAPIGDTPASIAFLFDTISFTTGMTEPFRGFVLSQHVVSTTQQTPQPASAMMPKSTFFAPNASTIVWRHDIAGTSPLSGQTGGRGYAKRPGVPIHVPSGTEVTLQLAASLKTP